MNEFANQINILKNSSLRFLLPALLQILISPQVIATPEPTTKIDPEITNTKLYGFGKVNDWWPPLGTVGSFPNKKACGNGIAVTNQHVVSAGDNFMQNSLFVTVKTEGETLLLNEKYSKIYPLNNRDVAILTTENVHDEQIEICLKEVLGDARISEIVQNFQQTEENIVKTNIHANLPGVIKDASFKKVSLGNGVKKEIEEAQPFEFKEITTALILILDPKTKTPYLQTFSLRNISNPEDSRFLPKEQQRMPTKGTSGTVTKSNGVVRVHFLGASVANIKSSDSSALLIETKNPQGATVYVDKNIPTETLSELGLKIVSLDGLNLSQIVDKEVAKNPGFVESPKTSFGIGEVLTIGDIKNTLGRQVDTTANTKNTLDRFWYK